MRHPALHLSTSAFTLALLAACGGSHDELPQLGPASASALVSCSNLAAGFSFPNTRITGATVVARGGRAAAAARW